MLCFYIKWKNFLKVEFKLLKKNLLNYKILLKFNIIITFSYFSTICSRSHKSANSGSSVSSLDEATTNSSPTSKK